MEGKKLLLGVTGSIAAYKSAELVRLLKKAGAEVQVLMSPDAAQFITPLTLSTLSEREVLVEIFPSGQSEGGWTKHITLGLWADLYVIAPATAQTLARLAHGFSDMMLTATALAARCPLLLCPAMDHDMFVHPATQANLGRLRSFGYEVMEPGYGSLASGLVGLGRLPEPEEIFAHISNRLKADSKGQSGDAKRKQATYAGKHVLVTAGPTQEAIDPVRFLSNHSTGIMGFALAQAARNYAARVTLVSGPTTLDTPAGVERIDVVSAQDMYAAVQQYKSADFVIMAAAVADYTPAVVASSKIKKTDQLMSLQLQKTPDILATLGREKRPGQVLVGFALETDDALDNARKKLAAKHLDWIVLNNPREPGAGFGVLTNRVTMIRCDGETVDLPLMSKQEVAEAILMTVARDLVEVEGVS